MTKDLLPDVSDRYFSLAEAAFAAGAAEQDVRNWLARKVIPIGKKHRLGRWMFSAVDIITLQIVNNLVENCGLSPSNAAVVTQALVEKYAAPPTEELVPVQEWYAWHRKTKKIDIIIRCRLGKNLSYIIEEFLVDKQNFAKSGYVYSGPSIAIPISQILKNVSEKLVGSLKDDLHQDETQSGLD